ncbi:MAG: OmpA family protein [Verrucomicrobiota bacterium]
MRLKRISSIVILVALALSLGACKNFGKKKTATAGTDGDFVNGTPLPERQEGVSFTSDNVDKKQFAPVHFGFDSCSVEAGEQGKINTVAEFLKSNQNTIIIAGFTDERGTPEYNRGLGERRAQAVRSALISKGADASKLQTVSFGSEMPADSGSGDAAWAKNRRAEFGVVK